MTEPAETVVDQFLRAWSSGDFETVDRLIADDVVFNGPGQSCSGRTDYLALLAEFAARVTGLDVQTIIGRGDEVVTFYTVSITGGSITGGSITGGADMVTAERFLLTDGRIRQDQVVFDTGPALRAAGPSAQ